ncbi:NeuD/PglB/VioB family sugar acetyltransferase [Thermoproteota archaeon]
MGDNKVKMKNKKMSVLVISIDKEIIELVNETKVFKILGVIDRFKKSNVFGYPILGEDSAWQKISKKIPNLKVILAVDPPKRKKRLAYYYGIKSLATLISDDAYISDSAVLGKGCILQRGIKIMSSVKIGIACKMNVNAVAHHDTIVGDFCTLAPGSMLLGGVEVGDNVFVGAGSIVLPKVKIGSNSVIGAGAVVVKNVTANSVVAGVPARKLLK